MEAVRGTGFAGSASPFLGRERAAIEGEGWVLLKIPRGDMNGVGEDEVTVTSGLHAQAERTNKQTEERGLHRNFGAIRTIRKNRQTNRTERATGGGGLDRSPVMLFTHEAARLATQGVLCRKL